MPYELFMSRSLQIRLGRGGRLSKGRDGDLGSRNVHDARAARAALNSARVLEIVGKVESCMGQIVQLAGPEGRRTVE